MRIACPSCAAQYEVPTSRLTSRKMVRCVRCGGEWAAVEKAEQPDPAHAVEETPEVPQRQPAASSAPVTAMDHLAATAALPPRRSGGLIAAWILTLAVLIVAVAATIAWRDTVTRIWPASSRILGTADTPTPAPARSLGKLPD
jgi:predicted Zn finger-like uncharacterized protein